MSASFLENIDPLLTAMVLLTVNLTLAFNSTAFLKTSTLDVQSTRISSTALSVDSADAEAKLKMKGYEIAHDPSEQTVSLRYDGESISEDFSLVYESYSSVVAPTDFRTIDSQLCIYSENDVLYLDVEGCAS
ncbi:hypothetical protein [Candidatus Nanohalococcus occultus]|uniref:hypothetical protein n=1 Tax=Candidatus Nanohalococcus occultus TaxID=2978047 RepID=UPI0039E0535B